MGRIARVVIPGLPHHVTQRGNRRQQTFFCDQDYRGYLALMGDWCRRCGVGVWAYCLMPNHAHLIVVPQTQDGLRRGIGEAHRRYTLAVNTRQRWTGHLWQGRFASVVMDETHLIAAARYIELNPVARSSWARPRTGRGPAPPRTWPAKRTSLRTRVGSASASPDGFAPVRILLQPDPNQDQLARKLRRHEATGRPLGDATFIKALASRLGRNLTPAKRGRKPKSSRPDDQLSLNLQGN